MITLRIADQGVGLPENISPEAGNTFGFTIVDNIINVLHTKIIVF